MPSFRNPFKRRKATPGAEPDLWVRCPGCSELLFKKTLEKSLHVCAACGHHFRVPARERIAQLVDEGTFVEADASLISLDPIVFTDSKGYPERAAAARAATGERDAAIRGTALIGGIEVSLVAMDFFFMGGSMGSVVGEKVARAAELAELGLVVEAFGAGAIVVREVPSLLGETDVQSLIRDLADDLASVDEALTLGGCDSIRNVLVVKRSGSEIAMKAGRDVWMADVADKQATTCEPEWVGAEHPLFLLYTSGSTGKPKGVQHSTGGYLLHAALTTKWTFDLKQDDVFWCTADIGWVTGHTYITYGPLALGGTEIVFEGVPTFPDAGRFWKMIQDHKVSIFYTAPTAIRSLIKAAEANDAVHPKSYNLSSLRLLGSVGEPINPAAWEWYHKHVGGGNCPIVDTFWQTETGGHMITPLPGVTATKPGSATTPFPGIKTALLDSAGHEIGVGGGLLAITHPWPSMLRTIWGDDARYVETYFSKWPGRPDLYFPGDGAKRDDDGYLWILGRVDDVLNVAGHRIGTMEVESALVDHPAVAEAAVVGKTHEIKGQAIAAFVSLRAGFTPSGSLRDELREHVAMKIGALARPDDILFSADLPKTRSGKIMRRLLRDIAEGRALGDTTTLADPSVVASLKDQYEAQES